MNLIEEFPDDSLSIFIEPPSLNELKTRLEKRGTDTKEIIEKRLQMIEFELSHTILNVVGFLDHCVLL